MFVFAITYRSVTTWIGITAGILGLLALYTRLGPIVPDQQAENRLADSNAAVADLSMVSPEVAAFNGLPADIRALRYPNARVDTVGPTQAWLRLATEDSLQDVEAYYAGHLESLGVGPVGGERYQVEAHRDAANQTDGASGQTASEAMAHASAMGVEDSGRIQVWVMKRPKSPTVLIEIWRPTGCRTTG